MITTIMRCPECSSNQIDVRYEGNKTIHMCAICKWFKLDWDNHLS